MFEYNDDTKQDISVAAYYLAEKGNSYDDLCWMLAERQLYLQNNFQKADENSIKQRAIKIYQTEPAYDVLCWLISEIDLILKIKGLRDKNKPHFILE
ncbi:MAG: hypothetical protein EU552_01315 [Promethearchaeota archaeon]|nr:MAG: hypothetical protein EU552_01315 [Candidatus Lokiarchaeota archaeon]